MKDVERLNGTIEPAKKVVKTRKKYSKDIPDYPGIISNALSCLKIDHVREYKFLEDRRFKFDLAIPKKKIAIEFEGGIFSGGRHTRGKGYAKDAKKYNLATRHQWKLLRYTTEDTKTENWEFKIATEILDIIKSEDENEQFIDKHKISLLAFSIK